MTSLSVGSLLDDNIWHDVVVTRNYREILFSVDRVSIAGTIRGEYMTLNLNNAVRIWYLFAYSLNIIPNLYTYIFRIIYLFFVIVLYRWHSKSARGYDCYSEFYRMYRKFTV